MNFLEESGQGIEFEDLMENSEKQRAWLRSLEVIGEATKNLSCEFRERHPEIEWRKLAGLRDKLIHHYARSPLAEWSCGCTGAVAEDEDFRWHVPDQNGGDIIA
jgi:uncharacterized protein with HEPN domain